MQELIEVMQILKKYFNETWVFSGVDMDHGMIFLNPELDPRKVNHTDLEELKQLGLYVDNNEFYFQV